MNILYVSSECVPFCKTGGLADVAGSLPQALAERNHQVSVMLPLYASIKAEWGSQLTFDRYLYVDLAWRHQYCGLFRYERDGIRYYFLDNEQYFNRPALYGYYDDGERFGFFARAVVALLPLLETKPQIVHCNDWQSALVPVYLRDEASRNDWYGDIKTMLTIHNIEYQGRYGKETVEDLFGLHPNWFLDGTLEQSGDVNLLKAGILLSNSVTTVSPTYAKELQEAEFAHGLEGILRQVQGKTVGILNGIDMQRYNPATDKELTETFDSKHLGGKAKTKTALQRELGLTESANTPLMVMVTRLVGHKGLDLVRASLEGLLHDTDLQFAVLGQGEGQFEDFFRAMQTKYAGRVSAQIGYSASLSQRMYGGADLFLMPSRSEPCGLSQMIAMRYGAVPIVRETGGLKDTVHAYEAWCGAGNGFSFAAYHAGDLGYVAAEAIRLYHENPKAFRALQKAGMESDFGWGKSAEQYEGEYLRILS